MFVANGEPPIGIPWETFQKYIREIHKVYYERKGNHVLVMAFARCVRGIVHCYNNTVELALFSFLFLFLK